MFHFLYRFPIRLKVGSANPTFNVTCGLCGLCWAIILIFQALSQAILYQKCFLNKVWSINWLQIYLYILMAVYNFLEVID